MEGARAVIDLANIKCIDEGDGPGSAEPYLWTVFFKIDGETAFVDTSLSLRGTATVVGTPGNHGNLPNDDVDEGENVPIPSVLGDFSTVLEPIPLQKPIGSTDSVSGVVGCIAVLMEEDGTPNSSIAKGHVALNRAVKKCLDELIPTLNFAHQEPTDEEIAAMEKKIGDAVTAAIENDVSAWDWLAGGGNMDDKIGSVVFHFSQKDLVDAGPAGLSLSQRWQNEGDWEITGRVAATPISWHGWEGFNGPLASGPAVASWQQNRLDCFVRGTNQALMHKWWNGSVWSTGWENLGGTFKDAPGAVSWGPGRIDAFVRGMDDGLWHRWWNGSAWLGWEPLGGSIASSPAVASWGSNRLDVFARGPQGSLVHKWWNGSTWSKGWEDLGGKFKGAPAAVSWGPNRIDVFVRGMDDGLWHKWWNGSTWLGWENLGPAIASAPAVASWESNRLDVFAKGTNGILRRRSWNGVAWTPWAQLSGTFKNDPGAVSWGPNRIDVFVRGMDDRMGHLWLS